MNNSVSIVIPVYNEERSIEQCIKALLAQTYKGKIELIVVNDGSTDKTSELVKSIPNVKLIEQSNQGRAAARNNGVHISSGEIIAFTDSDCAPQENWLEELVFRLQEKKQRGVVGGSIILPLKVNIWQILDHQAWAHSIGPGSPAGPTIYGSTANMCVYRNLFVKAGGFDVRLLGSEDSDLAFRIHKLGFENYFEPKAVVIHNHCRNSLKSFLIQRFNYGKWTIQTVLKHKPFSPYSWIFPNNIFLLAVFCPLYAVLSTGFTIFRQWRFNPSVFFLSPLHFIGRFAEYIGTIFGCKEYQNKFGGRLNND